MALNELLGPTFSTFGDTIVRFISKFGWILFIFVGFAIIIGIIVVWRTIRAKKTQWTHTLKVRRVLQNNLLSDPYTHKMRRFPLIKNAEVFELEKPLLGGYLIPELDQYSGMNEYSIILDKNNRIYTNIGEYFNPDKSCVNVSAKHAEIDIQVGTLKSDYQDINQAQKRIEWATIAKYALLMVGMVCVMVVAIVGINNWSNAKIAEAEADASFAQAMDNLAIAMSTVEATVNTQKLEILPMLKELYGTNNIQGVINKRYNNETV